MHALIDGLILMIYSLETTFGRGMIVEYDMSPSKRILSRPSFMSLKHVSSQFVLVRSPIM